ncbi:MAG: hypothetical protein LBP35_00510 [Candidatus Ancillula trichonymphae]|jgi:glucosamine--fructose-6-phosphate aminotransferase (isomerizing)|nr:hypothetical protein [Candidatus Ancillula trichonymphae]
MCGIVGYVGRCRHNDVEGGTSSSDRALSVVLRGLGRLEYRGYDSAGVALCASSDSSSNKSSTSDTTVDS